MSDVALASATPRYPLLRTLTHRLHVLAKVTDRDSHRTFLNTVSLPLGEVRCLAAVGSFAPLSVKHLAAHAHLNKGQASRAAQSLVDQGFVHKQESPRDGRAVTLTLTPKGEALWPQLVALIERRNDEVFGCLNEDELERLSALIDRLVEHAARGSAPAPSAASPA